MYALHFFTGRFDAADDGVVGLCECAHEGNYTLQGLECETPDGKDGHNMNRFGKLMELVSVCRIMAQPR